MADQPLIDDSDLLKISTMTISKPSSITPPQPKILGGPFVDMSVLSSNPSFSSEDAPSVAESDVSSFSGYESDESIAVSPRIPLQWTFHGLTLWVEYEEFDMDLTRAIDHAVRVYGTERIPMAHSTAIYGMRHLTPEQATEKLHQIPSVLEGGHWPIMEAPKGLTCDIAQEGRPGQVCSIAWAELTLRTNPKHENALDAIYELFDMPIKRTGPWTPHISLAYDNPEDSVLNMTDTFNYVISHPSLLRSRRVKAISLWNTEGKMGKWQCLDRVSF